MEALLCDRIRKDRSGDIVDRFTSGGPRVAHTHAEPDVLSERNSRPSKE
jgi:hypothetical protein